MNAPTANLAKGVLQELPKIKIEAAGMAAARRVPAYFFMVFT